MITVRLPNSDAPAIEFTGTLAFSGHVTADPRRRVNLSIYEHRDVDRETARRARDATERVTYAFCITFGSSWPHETTRYHSSVAESIDALRERMLNIDPSGWMIGYGYVNDAGKQLAQEKMQRLLRERWQALVATAVEHVRGGV